MQVTQEMVRNIVCANAKNPYADITPCELGFGLPEVSYPNFFPQKDEVLIYAAPAQTFKDKERVVGYSGRGGGASVRVAKGLSVRTSSGQSRAIRQEVRTANDGDFLLTNKRILFIGKDDSVEIKIGNISAVKPLSQTSLLIQAGRNSRNISFDRFSAVYALALINHTLKANSNGENTYEAFSTANSRMTAEQKQLCEYARSECSKVDPKKVMPKTEADKRAARYRRQVKAAKAFFIALAVFVIGVAVAIVMTMQ